MIKHYKKIWDDIYLYRFKENLIDTSDVIEWVKSQKLKEDIDFFTDKNRRRWYFREKKWAMSIKLIWG